MLPDVASQLNAQLREHSAANTPSTAEERFAEVVAKFAGLLPIDEEAGARAAYIGLPFMEPVYVGGFNDKNNDYPNIGGRRRM